jgi:hypothetical protein
MKKLLAALLLLALTGCFGESRVATSTSTPRSTANAAQNPATETRLLLGTRWEIAEFMKEIFGASTMADSRWSRNWTVADVVQQDIIDQPVSWGGSCDPYADVYPEPRDVGWAVWPSMPPNYVPPPRACKETKTSKESMLPSGSSSRMAWTIRACDYFASIDDALKVAVGKAGGNANAINTPPTDDEIRSAYDLFHPGVPLPPEVFSALKNVVTTANSKFPNSPEAWRFLIVTLCSSPSWQIL